MTDLLERLRDENVRGLPVHLAGHVRPPQVFDYDTSLGILAHLPAMRERGLELGNVMQTYLMMRLDRPQTLADFAYLLTPDAIVPESMRGVIGAVKELGNAMKVPAAGRQVTT